MRVYGVGAFHSRALRHACTYFGDPGSTYVGVTLDRGCWLLNIAHTQSPDNTSPPRMPTTVQLCVYVYRYTYVCTYCRQHTAAQFAGVEGAVHKYKRCLLPLAFPEMQLPEFDSLCTVFVSLCIQQERQKGVFMCKICRNLSGHCAR